MIKNYIRRFKSAVKLLLIRLYRLAEIFRGLAQYAHDLVPNRLESDSPASMRALLLDCPEFLIVEVSLLLNLLDLLEEELMVI